jgi:hypothetical protein
MPKICSHAQVPTPAMSEVRKLPSMYPPTLTKISSPIRMTRDRRECGASRYRNSLIRGIAARK